MDTFLGRALTDPATGLPNVPYFCLIQSWEQRRARRRKTSVRVIRLDIKSGGEGARRALSWRLCQDLRTSDLIASDGRDHFRILLTTPDAENVEAIEDRLRALAVSLSEANPDDSEPFVMEAETEAVQDAAEDDGPCYPCDQHRLTTERQTLVEPDEAPRVRSAQDSVFGSGRRV